MTSVTRRQPREVPGDRAHSLTGRGQRVSGYGVCGQGGHRGLSTHKSLGGLRWFERTEASGAGGRRVAVHRSTTSQHQPHTHAVTPYPGYTSPVIIPLSPQRMM